MTENKKIVKRFELPVCAESRKSFYGKATITEYSDGTTVLTSYYTDVARINPDHSFSRLWDGYSSTTMRHVNSFIAFYGLHGGGKKFWDAQPVEH